MAEACIPLKNGCRNAQLCSCLWFVYIERDVFNNFVKPREQATRFVLIGIYELTQKEIFPNINKIFQILLIIQQSSVTVKRMLSSEKANYN